MNTEQQFVADYLATLKVARPVFVDIGARDGLSDSGSLTHQLAKNNWKGYYFEPDPVAFFQLTSNIIGDHIFSPLIVSPYQTKGFKRSLYIHQEGGNGLSSCDERHRGEVGFTEAKLDEIYIGAIGATFNIPYINFLKIDAEGWDLMLFQAALRSQIRAKLLCAEFCYCQEDNLAIFKEVAAYHGYNFLKTFGMNAFFERID